MVIAGSRSIEDPQIFAAALTQAIQSGTVVPSSSYEIIAGGAKGVDTLARIYARENGYTLREFFPDYATYGRGAPLKRNTQMAANGDVLIAIWDGTSTGTKHMITAMEKLGKPVFIYTHK